MKHIFVANPAAGAYNAVPHIREAVAKLSEQYDVEIYETTGKGDATAFVRGWCATHKDASVRFYACGGDGTLNEVMSGVLGYPKASISCYPCGSGNDFVKYYGADRFADIAALMNGEEHEIDILTDGERYSMNVTNFGFEYAVCQKMTDVKRSILWGGKRAYTYGVIHSLFHNMKNKARVLVDGEPLDTDENFLLCSVSNGRYVGGAYQCAPHSDNEDGLLDICLVKPVSIPFFVSVIGAYKKGTHLDDPRLAPYIRYVRGKKVEVVSEDKGFGYTLDGENVRAKSFTLQILPKAVRFAVPPLAQTGEVADGQANGTEEAAEEATGSAADITSAPIFDEEIKPLV